MRLALLQSIRSMTHDLEAHEALANQLDGTAAKAYDRGESAKASVLRLLMRHYRIQAMNIRGNLEIDAETYKTRYQSDLY
nr:hypothetical protein [Methylobacterium sp. L1A1]